MPVAAMRKPVVGKFLLVVALIPCLVLGFRTPDVLADGDWSIQVVDSGGYVGRHPSIDIDASGYPHVAYCEFGTGSINAGYLKYAYWTGSAWNTQRVKPGGRLPSLALDAEQRAHISDTHPYGYYVNHAYWNGSTWNIERLVDTGGIVGSPSLALDGEGHPSISYAQGISGDRGPRYVCWNGTDWSIDTISEDRTGRFTSLALTSLDEPLVVYTEYYTGDLEFAAFDGSTWDIETIDSSTKMNCMRLDASDDPHVAYYYVPETGDASLRYARKDSTGWHVQTIDEITDAGQKFVSLALDSLERPHVSYTDAGVVKYAYYDGSEWLAEVVDNVGPGGELSTSLALDNTRGVVHIAYFESTGRDLKYARRDIPSIAATRPLGGEAMRPDKGQLLQNWLLGLLGMEGDTA